MDNILKYLSATTEFPEIVYSRTPRRRGSCKNNETTTSKHDKVLIILYTVTCVLLLAMCVKGVSLGDCYEQRSATSNHTTVA